MKKLIGLIFALLTILTIACDNKPIEPFELSIADYNYSLAYSILYKLSNENLTILFRGELENEKDSILYSTNDLPKRKIRKLANIKIDSLSIFYSNNCVRDGDVKSFYFKKGGVSKKVQLNNYYHKDLSPTIEIINEIVPEKYRMNYNVERTNKCGSYTIIKDWDDIKSEK